MSDVRPTALLSHMEEEDQVMADISNSARRVKIELKHTWNMRLLPVTIGPEKMPYVRIAQHWRNKRPVYCPVRTPKAWGGDPQGVCPVCDLSKRYSDSSDEGVRSVAYAAQVVIRFRTWVVVFDQEDPRGNVEEMRWEEVINPYEFEMYKNTWEDFKRLQQWAATRRRGSAVTEPSPWGIMDLDTGCNVLATHQTKGVRLERQDPGPIFDLPNAEFDAAIAAIWAKVRKPISTLPTEKTLLEMAMKFEDDLEGGSRGRSRTRAGGGSRRSRNDSDDDDRSGSRRSRNDDDDAGEERGSTRSRRYSGEDNDDDRPASVGSRRSTRPAADDQDGQAEAPTRESRAGGPARRPQSVTQEDLDQDQVPGAEVPESPMPPPRRGAAAEAEVTPRREAAEPPRRGVESEPPRRGVSQPGDPAPRRSAPAEEVGDNEPPRRGAAAAGGPPAEQGVDPEEDNVPEEARDPAPPIKDKVVEEPPPAVSASGPAPTRSATRAQNPGLQSRIQRLTQREKG